MWHIYFYRSVGLRFFFLSNVYSSRLNPWTPERKNKGMLKAPGNCRNLHFSNEINYWKILTEMQNSTCIQSCTLRKISQVFTYLQLLVLNWGLKKKTCRIKEQMETPEEQMKNCQEWLRWNRAKYFYQLLKQDILGSEIRSWAITPSYASTWDENFNFVLPASINKKIKEKRKRNFLNISNKTRDNLITYKLWKGSPLGKKKNNTGYKGEMLHSSFVSRS